MRYSSNFCGAQGGSLVLGHDQDNKGGGFDANQAPQVWIDSLRTYQGVLTEQQINNLASKKACIANNNHNNWAFFGADLKKDFGPADQPWDVLTGTAEDGITACEAR